ncbi:hypothetical protein ES705_06819 [subsurface metagenome]
MKTPKDTIRKILNYLNNPDENGGFWLPNIQRKFVWKEDQIEKLFDSILREYPIGTLLLWKTKDQIKRRRFIDNFRNDIRLSDFYVLPDDSTKMLVLDGQQRLQSLYIGLKGSYEKKELAIDIHSGDITAPEDIRFKFKFLSPDEIKVPWIKFKDIVFSSKEYNQIASDIKEKFDCDLSSDENERIETNVARIVRIFVSEENITWQEVDSVDFKEKYSQEDVVEVFIRANAGGTPLGKSDLLFSLLISSWEDADEVIDAFLSTINQTGYNFTRDFVLKVCLSLLDKGAQYKVEKFRDPTIKNEIMNNWERISDAISEVKDFVYGNTFLKTDKLMPSYLALIPLIYFRYHFPDKWIPGIQGDIADYLLRTSLTGAYSGSPDNMIDKCNKNGEIVANGRSLVISPETILHFSYEDKEIHLLFNLWYGFNYQPSFDGNKPQVDHIFPRSKLRKIKERNPATGRMDLQKFKKADQNQLANLMLLTAEENGAAGKGEISPDEWFKDKPIEYLNLHLIPTNKELWQIENFETFIKVRKSVLLNKFSYLLGKAVT